MPLFLALKDFTFTCVSMCVSECGFVDVSAAPVEVAMDVRSPGAGVAHCCKLPCFRCCGLNSAPLQKCLTVSDRSSPVFFFGSPHASPLEKSLKHNEPFGKLPPSVLCLSIENLNPLCIGR